jgi:hypothetical protein
MVGGFAMTLVVFAAGAVLATVYFVGPSSDRNTGGDTAAIWSSEPVRVASAGTVATDAVELPQVQANADAQPDDGDAGIDLITTAAVAAEAPQQVGDTAARENEAEAMMMAEAHHQWCSDRYRSYRAEDGTYQPYGGPRQECLSPYLDELRIASIDDGEAVAERGFAVSLEGSGFGSVIEERERAYPVSLTRDHIQSCFDRYRSYRPEDNTYQPYDGGPRRQCM